MPSKRELLKEKSDVELTEMAKDKELSFDDEADRSDLTELIEENYSKDEIENWPELGINTIESDQIDVEKEDEEIEVVQEKSIGERSVKKPDEEDRKISAENVDVEERELIQRDPVFVLAVFGAATAIVVAILFLYFGM